MAECLFTNKVAVGSNPVTVTYTPDMAMLRARRSLTFRQTIECRFTLKLVRDMVITYGMYSLLGIIFVSVENMLTSTSRCGMGLESNTSF